MGQLNLKLATRRDDATLKALFETPGTPPKHETAQRLQNFLSSLVTGTELGPSGLPPSVAISIEGQATPASGTFELDTVVATDVCSINGVDFTCVANGATGNQFNVGADDEETAENLAAAINGSVTALVDGYVTAEVTNDSPVTVTVTAVERGISGNTITIASADATIVASGDRLEGGAADPTALTLNF